MAEGISCLFWSSYQVCRGSIPDIKFLLLTKQEQIRNSQHTDTCISPGHNFLVFLRHVEFFSSTKFNTSFQCFVLVPRQTPANFKHRFFISAFIYKLFSSNPFLLQWDKMYCSAITCFSAFQQILYTTKYPNQHILPNKSHKCKYSSGCLCEIPFSIFSLALFFLLSLVHRYSSFQSGESITVLRIATFFPALY